MEKYNHKYSSVPLNHTIKTSSTLSLSITRKPNFLNISKKRMKRIFYQLLTIQTLLTFNLTAQQPVTQEWVRRFNDTSSAAWQAFSVKSDSMGFIYVLAGPGLQFGFLKYDSNGNLLVNASYWPGGYTSGGGRYFDVAPNGDVYITGIVENNPIYWIYTVKFNFSGVFQWGRLYNLDNGDLPGDINVDGNGNIIIVGGATGGYALTLKYNSLGDTLWTKRFRPGYPAGNGELVVDNSNNLYITGAASPPGIPGKCLILKYDPSGNLQWFNTFTIDSTRSNGGQGICLDAAGNIYIAGSQVLPPFGDVYNYLLKMNNGGTILWSRLYPVYVNNGLVAGPVVSRDGSSVYYSLQGANGMGGGGYSVFTLKYNPVGDTQWVRVFGGGGVYGTANRVGNIKLDRYDNIYVAGTGNYQTTGDDFATIKYSPPGVQQWVMTYTGIITNGNEGATDILIDTSLNVYVVGSSPNGISIGTAAVTIKYDQIVGIASNNGEVPQEFKLYQNYPNPFNPVTKIKFDIPAVGVQYTEPLRLVIYDILGREVTVLVDEELKPGTYEVEWSAVGGGSNYSSGVYFYKIEAGSFVNTKKMVLVK
jgi:hypothetical protein